MRCSGTRFQIDRSYMGCPKSKHGFSSFVLNFFGAIIVNLFQLVNVELRPNERSIFVMTTIFGKGKRFHVLIQKFNTKYEFVQLVIDSMEFLN